MKCKYCKSDCRADAYNLSSDYNVWSCNRCYGGISLTYRTEMRDDLPIQIIMIVPYQDKNYHITLDLVNKRTAIQLGYRATEMLANFNYVMKITPKTAEDKLKTILTFG